MSGVKDALWALHVAAQDAANDPTKGRMLKVKECVRNLDQATIKEKSIK
jgi:hypothetical protein